MFNKRSTIGTSFLVSLFLAGVCFAGDLSVSLSSGMVGRWQRVEMSVDGMGDYNEVFNPAVVKLDAELVSPSGKKIAAPGFAMHKMEAVGNKRQPKYAPAGDWKWKVRYMPDEVGVYKGRVAVVDVSGRTESGQFEFAVTESDEKGVIRVAKGNRYAFEYADGTPYIAIGHNLSWAGRDRVATYRRYLDKMAANGCNFIRVWLGAEWCFGILGSRPYAYNEDAVYVMDEVLRMCEERQIAIKVCFEHIRRFEKVRNNGNTRLDYPFMKANGGPCETLEEFILRPAAKEQWKALQRYIVARWGASQSIFAWEQWNEMNETDFFRAAEYPGATKDYMLAAWTEEMCAHLKEIDPADHMTSNSLGSGAMYNSIWAQPSVDFAQFHDYSEWLWNKGKNRTQYEVYAGPMRWLRRFGKPVLLAECGLPGREMAKDSNGYGFHEALWVGFMAGGAGCGHSWWWDNAIDPLNLYVQYKPFAEFVSDIPLNKAPMPPVDMVVSPAKLRCYARRGEWGAIAWVVNRKNSWRDLFYGKKEPEVVSGAKLVVPGLAPGSYRVQCANTWTGEVIDDKSLKISSMRSVFELPEFKIDIAVKIMKIE